MLIIRIPAGASRADPPERGGGTPPNRAARIVGGMNRASKDSRTDPSMSKFYEERVLSVHHWTDNLFSFRTTRDPAFRFRNGEFTMIGLEVEGRPLLRAYSVVSANYEEELEFFSIKVQDGPADLEAPAPQGRRPDHRRQEAHRHAGARQPPARPEPLPARHRHRARAVPVDHQGPGDLRAVREGRAGPWLPAGAGARLRRDHHRDAAPARVPGRDDLEPADLLPDRDPRAVPQPRPDHRPDGLGQAVRGYRPAGRCRSRTTASCSAAAPT